LEMDFLEQSLIEEPTELPHPTPIKAIIILIFRSINHIKVPT
jgi:hypothetical protein